MIKIVPRKMNVILILAFVLYSTTSCDFVLYFATLSETVNHYSKNLKNLSFSYIFVKGGYFSYLYWNLVSSPLSFHRIIVFVLLNSS
uniref:Uncharacterized protein n=1 Tax=Panstrongylus lignarius TaxID=156445 RepID=A0A224Y487_9HEMI